MIVEEKAEWPNVLRMLRRQHCLTQAELAKRCGLAVSTVKAYEEKKHRPQEKSAGKIARAFDIRPQDLPAPSAEN